MDKDNFDQLMYGILLLIILGLLYVSYHILQIIYELEKGLQAALYYKIYWDLLAVF